MGRKAGKALAAALGRAGKDDPTPPSSVSPLVFFLRLKAGPDGLESALFFDPRGSLVSWREWMPYGEPPKLAEPLHPVAFPGEPPV